MASPQFQTVQSVARDLGAETRTYFDLVRTHSCVTTRSSDVFKEYGLTEQQYHVLRVLQSAGPQGLQCLEIARQLPTPAPDVTRLLDRMLRNRLVTRDRLPSDRRVVMVSLTERGLQALEAVRPLFSEFHRERLSHMSSDELDLLTRLLRKARGEA